MLAIYVQLWGHLLEDDPPTKDHTPIENLLSLSQKPPTINRFSARVGSSCTSPSIHAWMLIVLISFRYCAAYLSCHEFMSAAVPSCWEHGVLSPGGLWVPPLWVLGQVYTIRSWVLSCGLKFNEKGLVKPTIAWMNTYRQTRCYCGWQGSQLGNTADDFSP